MFKFTLNVSGVDYTQYITYPFTLVEKNLDESENIYEAILSQTPFAAPIRPNQRAYITVEENGVVKRQLFLITVSDSVTKLGRKELYDHSLVFMEFTHFLEQQTLPNLSITRIEGIYEPTLKDVAEKILFAAKTNVSLSSETASILDNFPSPE